jgi:predicted dehydrogenase
VETKYQEAMMKITRREFTQMTALAAGSGFLPRNTMGAESKKIGYCIVGLGRISMQHFMPALKLSQKAKVTAVVSGHPDKAKRMAAEYGLPSGSIYSYENYDEIANNSAVDAVYIALPNGMHAEYSIRAAKAGKHVLCEKPMAINVEECRAMIQASERAGKKLMIAYRCQYEPANLRAIELLRQGKIGTILNIDGAFGFPIGAGDWRLDKKLSGGGPLMDVGIYCLNASRYLTGDEPKDVAGYYSVVSRDGRFTTVDETLNWTMKFPSGVLANCSCTYGGPMGGYIRVRGSKGTLILEPAFNYDKLRLAAYAEGMEPVEFSPNDPDPQQFLREADHFADCILQNKQPKTAGEEGLRDMELISKIYQSCEKTRQS